MQARVGRIVYYWATPAAALPWAAIITQVWTPGMVNLTVFPPDELPFSIPHIPRADEAPPDGPRWQWPALTEEGGP